VGITPAAYRERNKKSFMQGNKRRSLCIMVHLPSRSD
jgi:hypothetical protein